MNKFRHYISESIKELVHKVTWPTWSELQSSAIVVMIASLIIAAVVFTMDSVFQASMNLFYSMFV
jgi:preprotein translocase subunit SecE